MNRLLVLCAIVLSVCLVVWRGHRAYEAQRAADSAQAQLQDATAAARTILELTPLPATAIAPEVTDAELLRQVQLVLSQAGIASGQIREITLDPDTVDSAALARNGATVGVLRRRTGRLALQGLTLPQLGSVLAGWQSSLAPLRIEQMRFQRMPMPSTGDPKRKTSTPPLDVTLAFVTFTPVRTR
jgi:hypothetical protein